MTKINFRSKKEAVYEWIQSKILSGEFAPNRTLIIDELARTLNTSSIPVREALQQLEAEGFVLIKPYTGIQVTDIKPELIVEVFSMLETAEVISGRLACVHMCPDDLAKLEKLLYEMDDLFDQPDAWSAANSKFHALICYCSGTTIVSDILKRMLLHWDRLRSFYLEDVYGKRIDHAQQDHWEMFKAIQAGDPNRMEMTVHQHNRAALSDYIIHLHASGLIEEDALLFWTQKV